MATILETMMHRLAPERQERIETRAKELISEELTLQELRKALKLTQGRVL